jgi:hypothetical protein
MAFFDRFPLIRYDINKDGKLKLATDIMRRVAIKDEIINNTSYIQEYAVVDGETPEMVSEKFYGSPGHHWVVLLFNKITDPHFDWCLSLRKLDNYTSKKYPYKAYYINDITTYGVTGGSFIKGEEVYDPDDRTKIAVVHEWDATYKKLVLRDYQNNREFSEGDTIEQDNKYRAKITRKVDIHKEGVHHFENTDGLALNPYASPPVGGTGDQVAIGMTGASPYESTAVTFADTILYSYITKNDGSATTHSVVSFHEEEEKINEEKRNIKLLRAEHLNSLTQAINKVIKE